MLLFQQLLCHEAVAHLEAGGEGGGRHRTMNPPSSHPAANMDVEHSNILLLHFSLLAALHKTMKPLAVLELTRDIGMLSVGSIPMRW